MAKSAKTKTAGGVTTAVDRFSKSLPNRSVPLTASDIARRAYDLYLARGCEDGHDVADWLQAEGELRRAVSVAGA